MAAPVMVGVQNRRAAPDAQLLVLIGQQPLMPLLVAREATLEIISGTAYPRGTVRTLRFRTLLVRTVLF